MKKFMIFLLMAFLYLGTCQARSEASHPDNAKLKLLSWVTPTPSQSFLTRSADVTAIPDEVTVQIDGVHEGCANAQVVLTALVNYDTLSNFNFVWKVDGQALTPTTAGVVEMNLNVLKFDPEDLFHLTGDSALNAPVTHEFTVEVSHGDCSMSISPVHLFTVDPETKLDLVIPTLACDGPATSMLTAILTQGVAPFQYNWLIEVPDANGDGLDTLSYLTYTNEYEINNAVFAVAKKIGVAGIFTNSVCNTDTTWVENLPDYFPMHTITISGNNVICNGDTAILVAHVDPTTTTTVDNEESSVYKYQWSDGTQKDTLKTLVAGIYTVTVTNDSTHCIATASVNVITSGANMQIVADRTVICAGEYVTLGANFEGFVNENASYVWTKVGQTTPIATTSNITVNPDVTTKYVLTVNAGDCHISDSIEITVNALPADLIVTPTTATICEGAQATLTATVAEEGATAPASYIWYQNGIEIPGENLSSIAVNLNEAGSYGFTAKPVSANGCVSAAATNAATVTVMAAPVVTLTGNNVVCNGDSAEIHVNVIPAETATNTYTYAWNAGVPTNAAIMKTATGGIYTVTVTNNNNSCQTIASVEVFTNGANAQIVADRTVICAGEYVTLGANFEGFVNENASYVWTKVNGDQLATTSNITVNPTETTSYALTINAGNCSISDTINIKVNAAPAVVNVTSDTTICVGAQVTLTAAAATTADGTATTEAVNAASYVWYQNGIEIPGENLASIAVNFNEAGAFEYKAKAVSADGCVSAEGTAATVTVNAAPEFTLTGNMVVCNGDTAVITATKNASYHYAWSEGNLITTADTNVFRTVTAGTYSLVVTANGCTTTQSFVVNTFGGDLHVTADQTVVCPNTPVVLNANLDGFNNENISYQWTKVGGSVVGNGSTITVTPQATSKYAVKATAGNCEMNDTIEITVTPSQNFTTVIYNSQQNSSILSNNDDRLKYPAHYCEGQEIALYTVKDDASTGISTTLYNWYVDGVEVATAARNMIIPAGMEVGSHYVTAMAVVSGCNTASMSNSMNFIIHPAPQVTISGNNVICNGDTAFLTANATTMPYQPNMPSGLTYSYNYAWSDNANTQIDSITAAGLYTVTATSLVTYTNHHTNNLPVCTATASVNVTTFGYDLQLTADKMELCLGDMVTLNADLDGNFDETISYEWSSSTTAGLQSTTGSTVNAIPTTADTKTYTVTATNGNNGCNVIRSIQIIVHPTPDAPSISTGTDAAICEGDQKAFTASAGYASYIWYMDGVEIPGENLRQLTYHFDHAGTYNIGVKGVSQYGCVSPIDQILPVEVNAAPEFTLTGNMVVCDGDTAVITATKNSGYHYAWSEGNLITTPADTNVFRTVTAGTYSLTVNNATGCTSTQTFVISTLGADLQLTADKTVVCAGEPVVLNANLDGYNNQNISYAWNTDPVQYGSTITVFPEDTTTYVVTVNNGTCTKADSIVIYAATVEVLTPEITTVSNDTICMGEQAVIKVVNPAYTEYVWYMNGIEIPGENLDSISVNLNEAGIYSFAAAAISICASAPVSEEEVIVVNPAPEFTLTGNNIICNGATATITATPASYTYQWQGHTGSGNAHTYDAAGTYSVTATDGTCTSVQTFNIYTNGADLQVTADRMEICAGESVVLNADLDGFTNDNISYAWSNNAEGSTIMVTPSETTTYEVTATSTSGCTMEGQIIITVHQAPSMMDVSLNTDDIICAGGQATFVANAQPNNVNYIWFQNGVQIPGENLGTITVNLNEPGTYVYSAMAIDQYGCTSAAAVASTTSVTDQGTYVGTNYSPVRVRVYDGWFIVPLTHYETYYEQGEQEEDVPGTVTLYFNLTTMLSDTVTVNAAPDFTLSGNNIICNGATATITAASNTADTYTYTWSNGQTGATFTTTTAGTYSVTASDGTCTSVQTFNIYTNGSDLQVYADRMEVCEGEMVVLNANLDGFTNDNISYAWSGAGLVEHTGSTVSAIPTVANHTYTVVASTTGTNAGCTMTGHLNITVHPLPAPIDLYVSNNTICEGGQVVLDADGNAASYIWYQNGVEIPGQNQQTLIVNLNEEGVYAFTVKGVSEYGCVSEIASAPEFVNVVMQPTVAITGDPMICHNNPVVLYANLNDIDPDLNYTYEWRLYNYTVGGNQITLPGTWFTPSTQIALPDFPGFIQGSGIWVMSGNDAFVSTPLPAQDYPYIFTVVVTTPEGCRVESEPYYVYVGEDPEVVVTVDYTEVCAGGQITARAHLGNYNMDNLTAQWYERTMNADGTYGEWSPIPYGLEGILNANPTETTQYMIRVTNAATGCYAESDPVTVNVVVPVQVDHIIAVNSINATNNVCEGAQLMITAYVLDENGQQVVDNTHNYVWALNGIQLNDIHGAHFSSQAGIYDNDPVEYIYTAYIDYEMPGCIPAPINSEPVYVHRNPIVTIDGNPNVCYYGPGVENVVLTAWVDGVVDLDATYTWYESGQYRPNPSGFDNNYRESWVPTYENPYIFTVEVTNGDGCSTISDPFYVNVFEKPVVNITGDADAICVNGNVTLQANLNNYNDPMLTFQWYENEVNNTHILNGATHEVENFQPAVNTDYIVMVTHLMDFNTQYCVAYDTFPVAVNALPVVSAVNDLNGNDTICEGRSITMFASIDEGGVEGGEVYTWYRNGQVIENFHDNILVDAPVAIDNEPTSYYYAVKVQQAASGCESAIFTFDTAVVVFPNPTLQIATQPIVCESVAGVDNVTLTANIYPAVTTDLTYRWFEDNVEIAGATENVYTTHKDFRTYPYNFTVQTVNAYGCVSEASAQVYVNDSIIVNITASEDNICLGGNVTLNAALDNWNADMLTFQWFDNGTAIPGATTLEYVATPATTGAHEYTLTVNQLTSGCVANSTVANVNVNAIPEVTAEYANLDATSICDGRTVVINASVVAGTGVTGGEVYTWYRNGEVIANANGPVLVDNPMSVDNEPMIYHYAVSVRQAASGCESAIYHGLDNITVNPNPTITLVTDPIVCVATEGNVVLTANVFPTPATEVSYVWFEDNVALDTTTANTVTLSRGFRDYPYSFSVMLVNDYGCSATAEAQVSVNANPVVNITVTENNICVGGEITLSATLNDWNADMLTFQWSDNGQEIPGATMLHYTVVPDTGIHNYSLTVNQITSGCVGTSNNIEVVVNPIPVINGIQLSNTNICYGGQLEITALVDENVEGEVFTWYRNGVLMEGATAATIFDTPGTVDNNTQHYVYTAVVTRPAAGCVSLPVTSAMVTVYPNPTPVITGDQHVCETDSVFLIANVDTTGMAAGSLHYTWYESGQIRDNMGYNLGDNRFYAEYLYARTEPYRFTVEVSRNNVENGCSATSAEYLVYVYPQPVVNITASETMICENGQVTLTANLNDNNAENITYQWYTVGQVISQIAIGYDDNGNYVYANDTTIVHNIIPGATSATYTTSLTETTTLGVDVLQTNSTCTANDEILIFVNPIPVVTEITVSDEVVCNGAQVYVAASTIPSDLDVDGAVFTWYRNGIEIPGATSGIFSENVYTTDNHETYIHYSAIVAFPASGCVSNMSEDATVLVTPAPTTVTINGNNVICEGSTTTLHAYSDVEGTFIWSNNVEGVDSIVVPAGVYTVTMMTAEGCEMTSEPFTVEAFGTDLLVSASQTSVCEGEHVTLYVNQDGWQGNVTYLWDTLAGNSTATTVDVQPFTTTTYHVTATVSSTNGSCSREGEVTIVVHPTPTIDSVAVSDTLVCEGTQVTFTAYSSSPTEAFIWYLNGFEIPGENQTYLIYNFNEAGVYNFAVKAISDENCISSVYAYAPAVTVTPAPSQVSITGDHVICYGATAELVAHADVEGTFAWSNGMTGDTVNVPAGVYNVTVTTSEGCSMTSPDFTVESFGTELTVTATETNICEGDHTTLSVGQNGWQGGNVTYEWSTGSTATTIDVQPDTTTTYTVTATFTATSGSCTQVGEITINVNPRPATPIVVIPVDSVCVGTQIAAIIAGGHDNLHVTWYVDGVELPGVNTAQLIFNAEEGVHLYSATVTSEEGCVSYRSLPYAIYNGNFVTAHYVGIAAPESVVITGVNNFCDGGSSTLYANVTASAPASQVTYAWFKDGVAMNNVPTADHITVTAAGSYTVVATVAGLCSTESMAYQVTVAEAPQMQLTATETEICVGGTTVITAEVTGWNNEDVNYNWSNGFQGSAYTFTATTAGVETFIVTASQSTSGCVAVDTINITVNAIPATPVVTVDNATVCDGGQVTLQVTNAVQGATYTWYRNGVVIPGATQATISESPLAVDGDATNYVYNVVANLPMSGCESAMSANTIVTVIPTPVATVSVDGNTTFCQGGNTTLNVNVTPAAAYTYQWYKDNVLIEGATEASYIVNEVARETAYEFTVVVSANAGCNVTAYAPAINVLADPVVTATISNDIVCVGGVATLTATVEGGVAGVNGLNEYTYQWYRNTPTESNQLVATGATYTTTGVEAAGNYSYWVVINNGYNCNALSTPVNFSVVELPVVTITRVAEYDATVCDGGETAIKANVTGGYGEISYQWYKNGNLMPGQTNQVLNIAGLAYGENDTYTVEVTQTGLACSNSASAAINTLVTVNPAYTVDITGFGNVCEGGTLTLTATVNNVIAGDVLSYQWYKIMNGQNAAINGATSATYSTSDLLLGNSYEYFVVVSSNMSGCTTVSSTVPANVVAAPSVAIQGANTVCEGGNLTLNAFVTGGVDGSAYTYTWNWTGAATGTAVTADPNFVPTFAANDVATPYYVTVTIARTDNTGCTATSAAHEVNVLAVPTVSVTADNAYVCQNGDVTLTAHVSPVGAYNYVWTINGQQQAVNAASVTTSMANVGAINATVVVSAANASASCSATATLAAPVQVVAAPSVTIAADHTTMCVGGTTTLTANVAVNGNIPADFSYQWAINGIEVDGAVANTFVQPLNAAGVYTYTLRVSQNNNLGCNSTWSAPVTVQVAEQPVVALSSVDGLNICEGGSITLTGTVTNYGNTVNGVTNSNIYGAMTFDWTRNGANVHQDANVNTAMKQFTETLNTIGNYNYTVTVDAAGYNCQPQVSNVETVSVVGNPSWTDVHVYSNNGTDACLGEMVYLMAAIQGGVSDGATSTNGHIQWVVTDENGNTVEVSGGLGGNSYDIPAAAGTFVYTPTFVGNIGSGCQLTNTGDVQVGVTVHELPTAEFVGGSTIEICANDASASAELVINFTGVAPFVYEVVDDNNNVVAHATTLANTATIYVSPSAQTTYRISLVQDAYCENTALDATAVVTVYVNEVTFDQNIFVSGCEDNGQVTVFFNVISGDPTAEFTVVYEYGSTYTGTISNGTATFPVPPVPGDYNATITIDGCSYDIVIRVLVGDYGFGGTLPIMDQRWNDVVVVNNNPETNGGHTFVGFQWYHNGVAIPGATYSNYQDKDGLNGFYSVELIEQDDNGNMITYRTCEMYFNGNSNVKVYPVPANVRQEITIELDLTSEQLEGAVLDIYSVTGAHISHVTDLQPITKIEGFKAQGTYFGRILTGTNEIKTVKFVIVK